MLSEHHSEVTNVIDYTRWSVAVEMFTTFGRNLKLILFVEYRGSNGTHCCL